jgi:glyoxylase-like metal-dependent hydrolase (beta-lactamase superfamily II)
MDAEKRLPTRGCGAKDVITHQLGDVTINSILDLEMLLATPVDFYEDATPEAVSAQLHWLKPKALDPKTGKIVLPIQSYLVRTRHHTILIDTCVGCQKSDDQFPELHDRRDEAWLRNLRAAGVRPGDIDYVFCTHLHLDHCGWNTRLVDGRWVPTFPNAKYVIAREEYAASEDVCGLEFRESVLPIMEAKQAVLVETDYALDDEVWLIPAPGHTPGHVAVNISSQGRNAVMSGDVIISPIQLAYPDWNSFSDSDKVLAAATRKKFLDTHCDTATLLLTAHFPLPSVGHLVSHSERPFDFAYL